MARNCVAMSNFFFINSCSREYLFEKENQKDLSFQQNAFISTYSSIISITISSPFDVIKTRIQNKNFGENINSFIIVKNIFENEGIKTFFKGLNTKLFTVVPKIVFSYSVSQYFISKLENN